MEEAPIEVYLDGKTYRRYPDSNKESRRRYYILTNGDGFKTYHRDVWKKYNGIIPKGYHIHHKDGNFFNNDISNLECLSPKEHSSEHPKQCSDEFLKHLESIRKLAAEWHSTEKGVAWHREHGKATWDNREKESVGVCGVCGKEVTTYFKVKKSENNIRYCSRKCHRKLADKNHKYDVEKDCPSCGEKFWQNKYKLKPETCSRKCNWDIRKRKG